MKTIRERILANISVLAGYLILGLPVFLLSGHYHVQSPVWPLSGLGLAAFILWDFRIWPSILAGSFLTLLGLFLQNLTIHEILFSAGMSITATAEAFIGFYLLKNTGGAFVLFRTLSSLKKFVMTLLPMVAVGSLLYKILQLIFNPSGYLVSWPVWAMSDFLGISLFSSLFIATLPKFRHEWTRKKLIEFSVLACCLLAIMLFAFYINDKRVLIAPTVFLSLPLFLWLSYRFPTRTVLISVVISLLFAIFFSLHLMTSGSGALFQLQAFAIISFFSLLFVHIAFFQMKTTNSEMLKTHTELEVKVQERTREIMLQLNEKSATEQALRKSEQQLREINATKDKFFSIIAHDLRNPFNSLLGFGELLVENLRYIRLDEVEGMLKSMNKSVRSVYTLLENLLSWSRIQTGNIKFNPQVLDLKIAADENIELLDRFHKEKNLIIINDISDYTLAFADTNMISAVFRNLIANAIKYSYPGGMIKILVIDPLNEFWQVQIKDEGVGINPEIKDKIFTEQVYDSQPGTMDERGTGLGTKISHEFVERNCGKIWIESEIGVGTTVNFTVPKKKAKR